MAGEGGGSLAGGGDGGEVAGGKEGRRAAWECVRVVRAYGERKALASARGPVRGRAESRPAGEIPGARGPAGDCAVTAGRGAAACAEGDGDGRGSRDEEERE